MAGQGTATINFGAAPGANEAQVVVTGQPTIVGGSAAEAFLMADSTSDHTPGDHAYAGLFISLTCGAVAAGEGFTIYARSTEKLVGTYQVRWVWA